MIKTNARFSSCDAGKLSRPRGRLKTEGLLALSKPYRMMSPQIRSISSYAAAWRSASITVWPSCILAALLGDRKMPQPVDSVNASRSEDILRVLVMRAAIGGQH